MRRLAAFLAFVFAMGVLPLNAANVFVSTVVVGMATRTGGTYTFASVAVPVDVRGLQFTMDISDATEPLPAISCTLEGSLDGGVTWVSAGGFSRSAGPKGVNKAGETNTFTAGTFFGGTFWSDTTNVNRRLRGSATIGGTMRFALTVQPL